MNTYSNLTAANASKTGSLAKLSSGLRINKAGDDAAGLAISEKMKNQVSGLTQATRNAQDGISLIQTAEGGLSETHSILNRMRDLTVQASNDTNTNSDRSAIQKEIDSLSTEVERISTDTQFNTKPLLKGGTSFKFQIGANSGQNISISIADMSKTALLGASGINVETPTATADPVADAAAAAAKYNAQLGTLDDAIGKVSTERASLGATQNRLDHTINNYPQLKKTYPKRTHVSLMLTWLKK